MVPGLATGSPLRLASMSFDMMTSLDLFTFDHFLIFRNHKMLQAYFVFFLSSPAILHRSLAYLLEIGIYSIGFTHYKTCWEIYINTLNMRYIRHVYKHVYILTCCPAYPVFVLYLRLCTLCIHETLMY